MLKIEQLYAFVAENKTGECEGIMAMGSNNGMLPLVAADYDRVKQLFPIAKDIEKMSGQSFKLIKFYIREDITEEMEQTIQKEGGDLGG